MSITGSFAEGEARSLARVLNRGAFPADVEVQRVETVSPTLGQDSLRASIFAGLVGVVLLLLLLVVFYRRLTLLIAAGMVVWGMLIYSVAVFISQTTNYALTLAGVTGIIVSIGMTVDSYVVYFERMKDEVLPRPHVQELGRPRLHVDVADDPRRQPGVVHRRRRAVRAQRRLGPRLRPVPRRDDGLRRHRAVVLHPPGRHPAGRHRSPRPPRPRSASDRPDRRP